MAKQPKPKMVVKMKRKPVEDPLRDVAIDPADLHAPASITAEIIERARRQPQSAPVVGLQIPCPSCPDDSTTHAIPLWVHSPLVLVSTCAATHAYLIRILPPQLAGGAFVPRYQLWEHTGEDLHGANGAELLRKMTDPGWNGT